MQVTLVGRAHKVFTPGSSRHVAATWCEGFEQRLEVSKYFDIASRHDAVTALHTPDAATGADVRITNAFMLEKAGAPDIVLVVRVAAINDDVSRFHSVGELQNRLLCGGPGRDHHPCNPRLPESAHELVQG